MKRGLVPRLIGVGSLAAAAYAFVIRPWMLAWGSTVAERTRPLPGDEVEPDATYVTTRAVTIKAPAQAIWPWLLQMGRESCGLEAP